MKRAALLLLIAAGCCTAQSASVQNAIGFTNSLTNVLAPEMLATLTEANLIFDPYNITPASVPASVFIRPAGTTAPIPVTEVSAIPGIVTFLVPAGIPYGTAQLYWQINGEPYQSINVTVAQTNFELARLGQAGPALARVAGPNGTATPLGLTTPAQPGQTVLLTGSGIGYGTQVMATLGGLPATVLYAGHDSPAGHDSIQIQVPTGVAPGCYVPLALTVGQMAVTSTISVTADGSPCQHPFQLSVNDMKTLDSGGWIAAGQIQMSTGLAATLASAASRTESVNIQFNELAAADVGSYFAPANGIGACTAISSQTGLIGVWRAGDFSVGLLSGIPVPAPPNPGPYMTLQNAAATINVPGSQGYYGATLPAPQDGPLSDPPPPVIAGGKWTWNSPGSSDLAPSSFVFTLPAPLQINGGAPLSLARSQDQTFTWNGAGYDAATTLTAFLNGHTSDGTGTRNVTCVVSASAGSLTIPAALLAPFPAASIGTLTVQISPAGASMPHALLKTKTGATVLMLVSYTTSDNRPIDFQ
jgi:uncharacterized protein (TIGR03437 family)